MKLWITNRQLQILRLLCEGKTYKEAAHDLCMSTKTVEGHMQQAVRRNHMRTSTQLAVEAIRSGQVVLPADQSATQNPA